MLQTFGDRTQLYPFEIIKKNCLVKLNQDRPQINPIHLII